MLLNVSVPSHSSLMRGAGESLASSLSNVEFNSPSIPVVSSVHSAIYQNADEMRQRLSEQVHQPVRWVETIQFMIANGASAFVECGPGKVLTGLLKRIDRSVAGVCIDSPDTLQKALQQ